MTSKKGSAFERTIARELSLWYSEGERDDIFYRTAGSGGRATMRMKQGKKTADSASDIMAIHEDGKPFTKLHTIEIKRGYNRKKASPGQQISILSLIDTPKRKKEPTLFRWWDKVEKEKREHNRKYSLIIFRRDRHNTCICLDKKYFDIIESRSKKLFAFPKNGQWIHIQIRNYNLIIFLLNDFLKWAKPFMFSHRIKRRRQ